MADPAYFRCLPGCGLCCLATPHVAPWERPSPELTRHLVRGRDGRHVPNRGCGPCVLLTPDRKCSVYADRPHPCRAFPFHQHVLDRAQVQLNLGCPGVDYPPPQEVPLEDAPSPAPSAYLDAQRRRAMAALSNLGVGSEELAAARAALAAAPLQPDQLRATLGAGFDGAVAAFHDVHAQVPDALPIFSGPGLAWWSIRVTEGSVRAYEITPQGTVKETSRASAPELPGPLRPHLEAALGSYAEVLRRRDHTIGHAAWLLHQVGPGRTPGLGPMAVQAAAHALVHAWCLDACLGALGVDDATMAMRATDMMFLDEPTVGAMI